MFLYLQTICSNVYSTAIGLMIYFPFYNERNSFSNVASYAGKDSVTYLVKKSQ